MQGKVFEWFETHTIGLRHRGPGVGLSCWCVRSPALHGGKIDIDLRTAAALTVTECRFPLDQAAR